MADEVLWSGALELRAVGGLGNVVAAKTSSAACGSAKIADVGAALVTAVTEVGASTGTSAVVLGWLSGGVIL